MKGSSFVAADVRNFSLSHSLISSKHLDQGHVTLKPLLAKGNFSLPKHVGCVVKNQKKGKSGIVREMERELEGEIDEEKGKGKGNSGMMRFREKCGGERKGVVELLECLEKEAIMGDDVGKEANDYSRRAKIFDRSSRVFQAIKEFDDHA